MKRELSRAWRSTLPGLCVALPFFLPASLAAQWQPLTPQPKLVYDVTECPWGGGFGTGPFQKVIYADLNGDLMLDAVVLDDGVPVISWSASVLQCQSYLVDGSFEIRDLDRLPGAGAQDADGVFVLTSAGLQLVVVTNGTATVTTVSAAQEWKDATKMRVVDLGAGQFMVVCVAPDAHTFHSVISSGTSWANWKVFTTVNAVRDILVGNWDGDGMPEILVETTSALEPFGWRGLARPSIASIGTSLGIAVLPSTSGGYCEVGWVEQTATDKKLTLVDRLGRHASNVLQFPISGGGSVDFDFVGVGAGDVDLDGDADLVITQKSSLIAIVLYNNPQGAGAVFGPFAQGHYRLLFFQTSPYQSVPGNNCPASVADWDRDGRADVLTPRDDTRSLNLQSGIGGDPGSQQEVGLRVEDILHETSDLEIGTSLDKLHLVMHLPTDYRNTYAKVQCVVWKQDEPGTQLHGYVFQGIYTIDKTVSPVPECQYLTIDWSSNGTFPSGEFWPHRNHFYVVFRFVNLSGNDVIAASPAFAFGMTLKDAENSIDYNVYLEGLPNARSGAILASGNAPPVEIPPPPAPPPGRQIVGSIVIQRVLPPSDGPPTSPTVQSRAMTVWNPEEYWPL